jgi:hypothetical protein
VPRKTDFSDNIAHRDMEKYLTYEPIDVVSVCMYVGNSVD